MALFIMSCLPNLFCVFLCIILDYPIMYTNLVSVVSRSAVAPKPVVIGRFIDAWLSRAPSSSETPSGAAHGGLLHDVSSLQFVTWESLVFVRLGRIIVRIRILPLPSLLMDWQEARRSDVCATSRATGSSECVTTCAHVHCP